MSKYTCKCGHDRDLHALQDTLRSILRQLREKRDEEPYFFSIETAGGDWHDGDYCVFSDRCSAEDAVFDLNEELPEDQWFRVVPLYRSCADALSPIIREGEEALGDRP